MASGQEAVVDAVAHDHVTAGTLAKEPSLLTVAPSPLGSTATTRLSLALTWRSAPPRMTTVIFGPLAVKVTEAVPEGADLEIERWSSSPPGLIPPDAAAIQLALDAFERVLGTRPALIRTGGTLPIVPALADQGIPTVITGFSLPDANIHSPNERLLTEYVPLGIDTAAELFRAFGALPRS